MVAIGKYFLDFVGLIYPELCEVCGNALATRGQLICTKCVVDFPRTRLHSYTENKTSNLLWGRIQYKIASSFLYYHKKSDYSHLLHKLKYKGKKEIGIYLGEVFALELKEQGCLSDIDILLPVPLHKKRQKKRGYNQSKIICDGIAKVVPIPIDTQSVIRSIYTNTQTKRNFLNRFSNVQDIFELKNPESLKNKHVLLVDDVVTTGATLESLWLSIKDVEGISVSIACVAISD